MNALATTLQSAGLTGTPAEVQTALQVMSYVRRDQTPYSYQGLIEHPDIGQERTGVFLAWMKSQFDHPLFGPLIQAEHANFTTTSKDGRVGGLDFSNETRNANLRNMAAAMLEEYAATAAVLVRIADLGGGMEPEWKILGLDELASVEQIADAQAQLALAAFADLVINTCKAAKNSGQTDIAALQATIAGL